MADKSTQYKEIIPHALSGLGYYINALHEDGSSEEGIGYWNYGVSYMAYALFSYEIYYGMPHPVFSKNVFRSGLSFPFDFSPQGAGISFGDVNHFIPSPIIYKLAQRANRADIAQQITSRLLQDNMVKTATEDTSSNLLERELYALLMCKTEQSQKQETINNRMKMYPDNGWAIFESGKLGLSFRSGSTDIPHAVKDLNSIQLAKNGVRLLENIVNSPYTLGWFTSGRELYAENQTSSKNAVLINGGGQLYYAKANWQQNKNEITSDAALAYPDYVKKAQRSVSLTCSNIVIKDEVETSGKAWHEARFITQGEFVPDGNSAYIVKSDDEKARLVFKSDNVLNFYVCELANSIAQRENAKMLRVVTKDAVSHNNFTTTISE